MNNPWMACQRSNMQISTDSKYSMEPSVEIYSGRIMPSSGNDMVLGFSDCNLMLVSNTWGSLLTKITAGE